MEEKKKAGILKLKPKTFVSNDGQELRVIHQEKRNGKNQKRQLKQKNEINMSE